MGPEKKLVSKCPISINKDTMYLRKRQNQNGGEDSPETEAGGNVYNTKAEDIEDDVDPASSLTVIKYKKSTISKLMKEVDYFQSVYDSEFKNFAENTSLTRKEVWAVKWTLF